MKRLIIAAAALSVLGGTAASAQPRHDDHRYESHGDRNDRNDRNDHRANNHRWSRGERLPQQYRARNYYVTDYRRHHLRQPPRGYQWVHVDNNYMLVALTSGLISQIIAGS